jgi:putative redox protein
MAVCSTVDVVSTLKKMRENIDDCISEVSAERADEHPKVFTNIHIHFVVKGANINSEKVEKAIRLSVDKYCSASIMMAKTANVTHDFEVVE